MVYTAGTVQAKYFINSSNFTYGFVTPDDSWSQPLARRVRTRCSAGIAALPGSGNGAKSLGQELAAERCVRRTARCRRSSRRCASASPGNQPDRAAGRAASRPTSRRSGYKLKQVFAEAAVYCMGQ